MPYTLGGRPRFTVDRVGPGQHRVVQYPIRSDARGRYRIGPLRLRLADPFGLVELTRSFTAVDILTVVPAVLFWYSTPLLMAFTLLFIVSYVWCYFSIVRFRAQRWMRRRLRVRQP